MSFCFIYLLYEYSTVVGMSILIWQIGFLSLLKLAVSTSVIRLTDIRLTSVHLYTWENTCTAFVPLFLLLLFAENALCLSFSLASNRDIQTVVKIKCFSRARSKTSSSWKLFPGFQVGYLNEDTRTGPSSRPASNLTMWQVKIFNRLLGDDQGRCYLLGLSKAKQ